ncbi:insect cuticle protein domain-containing protein [Phthorimaea operculella]|nr:insect cuticle protein domain-containing protein [Phthorimaea operculella]
MLRALVILMLIATIASDPMTEDGYARIIRYDNENDGSGNYHFSFETSNGLTREETGTLVNRGLEDEHIEVQGQYAYFDEQGAAHIVYYTADKDGYRILPEVNKPPAVTDYASYTISLPGSAVATFLG